MPQFRPPRKLASAFAIAELATGLTPSWQFSVWDVLTSSGGNSRLQTPAKTDPQREREHLIPHLFVEVICAISHPGKKCLVSTVRKLYVYECDQCRKEGTASTAFTVVVYLPHSVIFFMGMVHLKKLVSFA